MAAKVYYAWSPITIKNSVNGGVITLRVGDKVDRKQVGEDWDDLIAAGSIRTQKHPKTRTFESPNQALLREANAAFEKARQPFKPDADDDDDEETVDDEGVAVAEA